MKSSGSSQRPRRRAPSVSKTIDVSDIPELTGEQIAQAFRPNKAREYVGVRLDWDVLEWLKAYGPGHTTRINKILRSVMESAKQR